MENATTIENEQWLELQKAQRQAEEIRQQEIAAAQQTPKELSFGQKISKHWLILGTALFFDLLALIPFISIVFNFIFGGILYIKFGPKKIERTIITIVGLSIADFFLSAIPTNIAAALVRIKSS